MSGVVAVLLPLEGVLLDILPYAKVLLLIAYDAVVVGTLPNRESDFPIGKSF